MKPVITTDKTPPAQASEGDIWIDVKTSDVNVYRSGSWIRIYNAYPLTEEDAFPPAHAAFPQPAADSEQNAREKVEAFEQTLEQLEIRPLKDVARIKIDVQKLEEMELDEMLNRMRKLGVVILKRQSNTP